MNRIFTNVFAFLSVASLLLLSCSKSSSVAENPDPCAGKTIVINGTATPTSGGTSTNGLLTVTASGSTGFMYALNNGTYQSSGNFSGLAAGNYSVSAKDGAGCVKTQTFVITAAACPTISITATTTPSSNSSATDGSISASASGSTGFTYNLNGGAFQASGNFNNLAAGSYTIVAKDQNGCTGSAVFVVTVASCPTITVSGSATVTAGPTATNGTVTVSASGGVTPYQYSINSGAFQASNLFSNLAVGSYTVVVKDANGCLGSSAAISVASAPCPSILTSLSVVGSDFCVNNTGSVTVSASGSTGFTYSFNNGSFGTNNLFASLAAGNYNISIKDQNGCSVSTSATVPTAAAGAKFLAVRAVLQANCAVSGCHTGPTPQNGINFSDECTIVAQKLRIKARAVDGTGGFMPPTGQLSAADQQKITDWINAGGQHSTN